MVAYPGERTLYDAFVRTASFSDLTLYRVCDPDQEPARDGQVVSMVAGNDVYFYGAALKLLESDPIAEVNWIVELTEGGTFIPSTSYDLDYEYTFESLTWTYGAEVTLEAGRHVFPVPMEQRTWELLFSDVGLPAFRLQVTGGSPKMSGLYMQTEGPAGLLKAEGSSWGPWIEPALRPKQTTVSWTRYDYRSPDHTSGGHANGEDSAAIAALVQAALEDAQSVTPTETSYSGTLDYISVGTDSGVTVNSGSGPPYTYAVYAYFSRIEQTIDWLVGDNDFRPTPVEIDSYDSTLIEGRDYISWEYDPTGTANAEAWEAGWLYYYFYSRYGAVDDATFGSHATLGLSYTVSPFGTVSDGADVNSEYPEDPPAELAIPYTAPPGPIVISTSNPWDSVSSIPPPPGNWSADYSHRGLVRVALNYFYSTNNDQTTYETPDMLVRCPDFRLEVPTFVPDSRSIGGGIVIGPGYGDWYIPGWGSWDWFPDYTDVPYPYDPITDPGDYYDPGEELPTYHYLPFDLNTNTQLGELPLQEVSYSYKLSAPGTASFSIPVTPDLLRQQVKQSSVPGKTGLYIIRDGQIVWGGIIWKRMYDSNSRRVRFEAGSFESYFDHRYQSSVLGFEDVDQLTIARTLALQAADEMHVDVDTTLSGVNRYYTAFYYDFKTIGGEIDSLASLWDGFDWNIRVYLDSGGVVRRRLVWGYPNLGVSAEDTDLLFEYPGAIRSYTVTEDADKAGNRVWAIGGGQGLDQIQYEARDDVQLAAGWPLLETSTSYKDVFDPPRLEARSIQDLERLRPPVTVLTMEVDPFSHPKLGTYQAGDWARFIIQDDWNNPGIDIKRRIVGYNVAVSAESPLDRVTLDIDAGDTN